MAVDTSITLIERFAMQPAAAISGLYFSNLQAAHFGRGRIGRYQVEDYARRKGRTTAVHLSVSQ